MNLHYSYPDNLKNQPHRYFSLELITCNSKFSKKIYSLIIFNISENSTRELQFKRRIMEGFRVCFKNCIWKTSKVKSNRLFFILEKNNLGWNFWAKNVLTLLKRITDTFTCLALPRKITNFIQCCKQKSFCLRYSSASKNSETSNQKMQEHLLVYFNRL